MDDDDDDKEIFLEAVKDIEKVGNERIDVKFFAEGDELLNTIREADTKNCIVFLDINMPVKNGFQILTEIREEERLRSVPVIMYSTSSEKGAVKISFELGANLYVIKPDTIKNIKMMIEHVLAIDWKKRHVSMDNFGLEM